MDKIIKTAGGIKIRRVLLKFKNSARIKKGENKMEITKTTSLGEILDNYKNAEEILSRFGMHCFSCPMSRMETVEEASVVHGINPDEMVKVLKKDLKKK